MNLSKPKLIVCDLDNNIFCWISYFALATKKSIETAAEIVNVPYKKLCEEYKEILDRDDSIECPFVIQQLPSVLSYYKNDLSRVLTECSEPARTQFKLTAYPYLKPYNNVLKTLQKIRNDFPGTRLAVLTDAPCQLGIHRLGKLGILNYFDGIYGLENPKIPLVCGEVAVTKEILFKNLDKWKYGYIGRLRELPNDYRKPNVRGFKNILLDFNIDAYSKEDIIFVGDNVYKDVQLGQDVSITTCLAKFGLNFDPTYLDILREFVPERFIHKGINLKEDENYPKADYILEDFSELLNVINLLSK